MTMTFARSPNSTRIVVGIASIASIVWLAFDSGRVARRKASINDLLARHLIGNVSDDVRKRLETTVPWLASAAGVREPVVVDQPFGRSGVLHFFVTTGDYANVTLCGENNAVYDAALDAVFIDREIVEPMRWKETLSTPDEGGGLDIALGLEDLPSLRVYERFVILHELGHRQKHRKSGAFFDTGDLGVDAAVRAREDEADQFALERIETAYARAKDFHIRAVEEYTGDAIDYRLDGSEPVTEQVQVSLVEMAKVLLAAPASATETRTPYTESRSHASTFVRCKRLIEQSLRRPMDAVLRGMTETTYGQLVRMNDRAAHVVTVAAIDPIVRIFFDGHGLVACGARQRIGKPRRLLTCRTATFAEIDAAHPETIVVAKPNDTLLPPSYTHTVAAFDGGALLHITRDDAVIGGRPVAAIRDGTLAPLPGPPSWALIAVHHDYVSLHEGKVVSRIAGSALATRIGEHSASTREPISRSRRWRDR
jgi:hypothetical protein